MDPVLIGNPNSAGPGDRPGFLFEGLVRGATGSAWTDRFRIKIWDAATDEVVYDKMGDATSLSATA